MVSLMLILFFELSDYVFFYSIRFDQQNWRISHFWIKSMPARLEHISMLDLVHIYYDLF